jgi:hypothetical protein
MIMIMKLVSGWVGERELKDLGFTAFQRTMEREYMHNLSRWKYPHDYRRNSPSKNAKLRSIGTGDMLEGGNVYEERVNERENHRISFSFLSKSVC